MFKSVSLASDTRLAQDSSGKYYYELAPDFFFPELLPKLLDSYGDKMLSFSIGAGCQYVFKTKVGPRYQMDDDDLYNLITYGEEYDNVFFGPSYQYVVSHTGGETSWKGIPRQLARRLTGMRRSRGGINQMAFSKKNYIVQFNDSSVWSSPGVPYDLVDFVKDNYIVDMAMSNNFSEWYVRSITGEEDYCSSFLSQIAEQKNKRILSFNPHDINYTHDSISSHFATGESIFNVAGELSVGYLTPDDFPPIRVVSLHSEWYSLDNRRLWCFKRAGVDINVEVVPCLFSKSKKKYLVNHDMSRVFIRS